MEIDIKTGQGIETNMGKRIRKIYKYLFHTQSKKSNIFYTYTCALSMWGFSIKIGTGSENIKKKNGFICHPPYIQVFLSILKKRYNNTEQNQYLIMGNI